MKPDICLTMIVRNESKIIERCLRAAKPYITSFAISDTGSTDDTVSIIKRELDGIPGIVTTVGWRDFAYNRTLAFDLAKIQCEGKGYCLLLDADHEIKGLVPELLTLDYYMIKQTSVGMQYPNIRLIRANCNWKCVGVTHEYWAGGNSWEHLSSLEIIDHEDGGTRGEKWTRDEALLRQGLIDEPDNERYVFYLAQTIESYKTGEAIGLYNKRSTMGGYHEEVWMAQYRVAMLTRDQLAMQRIWELAPHRAEPLYWLANNYRLEGRNNLAMLYAKKAKSLPVTNNALFTELHAYGDGPDEEISIAGYYTDKQAGLEACERCIENPRTYELAHRNIVHYADKLPRTSQGNIDVPLIEGYSPGTVSICDDVISVRMLNYDQKYGREFTPRYGSIFHCVTQLCKNGEWWVVDDSILMDWSHETHIRGLEDWRLFKHNNRMMFTANCCMVPGAQGGPQVVLGLLSDDLRKVEKLTHLKYDKAQWCEKNWQAFNTDAYNGALQLVYSYDSFVVLLGTTADVPCTEIVRKEGCNLPRWRGSTPLIRIRDCYLGIVHDVVYNSGTSDNVYLHRFVMVNLNMDELVAVSHPFIFEHHGIEYTAGMQLEWGTVRIVYSVNEYESKWLLTTVDTIMSMFP